MQDTLKTIVKTVGRVKLGSVAVDLNLICLKVF